MYDKNQYQSKWCTKINDILNKAGLSFIWNFDGLNRKNLNETLIRQFSDSFIQNWNADKNENSLCINYRMFKNDFGPEPYLNILDNDLRIIFSKYRCGSHNLPISIRRYEKSDERNNCPLCYNDVGDEYHYIMINDLHSL